jgi:hypothetical protein
MRIGFFAVGIGARFRRADGEVVTVPMLPACVSTDAALIQAL